ncbi:MAG: hexapeptide transferase, partial [Pseudomonadota bacterium]
TKYKYGIAIPEYTEIGPGLFINRFGGIMINGDARIGQNCNLSSRITIGQSNRGERFGSSIIGDRVYSASGARVIGSVKIGDEALIGVNSVVVRDVPAKSVVGGIPALIISDEGTTGYVNRTWEEEDEPLRLL